MVAELGDVLKKLLIDFGKLFPRTGAVRLYERLDFLREEVVEGRSSVMIGRMSEARRFKIDKFSESLGLRGRKKVVGKRRHILMDALFYFEPVQRIEYRGDNFSFWGSSYCASKGVLQ